jgi:hypothetical protein
MLRCNVEILADLEFHTQSSVALLCDAANRPSAGELAQYDGRSPP